MSTMPPLRDIVNGTPVDAIDVDWNFKTLQDFVTQQLINRDGAVAMVSPLTTVTPTAPMHAATKQYVDTQVLPIGMITMFGGSAAPVGWALCNGASKSTTDPAYAALFAVVGYAYGGSGANFNLPDLRGRFPVGVQSGQAIWDALGEKGGSRDAVVVSHDHPIDHNHPASGSHTHLYEKPLDMGSVTVQSGTGASLTRMGISSGTASDPATVNLDNLTGIDSGSAGVAGTDKNLPPFIAVNYIIRIG